jgi:hypothetical protein
MDYFTAEKYHYGTMAYKCDAQIASRCFERVGFELLFRRNGHSGAE